MGLAEEIESFGLAQNHTHEIDTDMQLIHEQLHKVYKKIQDNIRSDQKPEGLLTGV